MRVRARLRRLWLGFGVLASCMLLTLGSVSAQETVRLTFWTFVDAHADYYLARARSLTKCALRSTLSSKWFPCHTKRCTTSS